MYHPFFQFVLPRLGQVALDALLYLNFLQLPPLQLVARWPVLYYGLPLVLMGVLFGIFVGGWILALAEIVNIFPIFARRVGITKGYSLIVIAIAVGKTAGSLYHFYRRWGM